jgi:hypothetical protein
MASIGTVSMVLPALRANLSTKKRASRGMSSRRSLSGGTVTGKTYSFSSSRLKAFPTD